MEAKFRTKVATWTHGRLPAGATPVALQVVDEVPGAPGATPRARKVGLFVPTVCSVLFSRKSTLAFAPAGKSVRRVARPAAVGVTRLTEAFWRVRLKW